MCKPTPTDDNPKALNQKFDDICFFFVAQDWSMGVQKLSNLLYLANRESLLHDSRPLFPYAALKTHEGVEYQGDAGEVVRWWAEAPVFIEYWFLWLSYLKGYMDYFS